MIKLQDILKYFDLPLPQKTKHIIGHIAIFLLISSFVLIGLFVNVFGASNVNIVANVILAPPENLVAVNIAPGTVKLTWDKSPASDYGHVASYVVYMKSKTDVVYFPEPSIVRNDILDSYSDTISGLDPAHGYNFIVRAISPNLVMSPEDCESCKATNANCGNGIVEGGELCDGLNLNGLTCTDFGYLYGTLSCTTACQFSFNACVSGGGGGGSHDTTKPIPGTAKSPRYENGRPIVVTYSGANDSGGSGLSLVELWFKRNNESWRKTNLRSTTPSGSFNFNGMSAGSEIYYFDLVAQDVDGNKSNIPTGDGDTKTIYDVNNPTIESVTSPETEGEASILVNYTNANDTGGSEIKNIQLWYKKGTDGIWQNSGLTNIIPSSSFYFTDLTENDVYYFDVIVEDNAENVSGTANGNGKTSTIYSSVKPVATLSGLPNNPTSSDFANIVVGGDNVATYKYKINGDIYSNEILVKYNIVLRALFEGTHTLSVVGKTSTDIWQQVVDATTYTWEVDFTVPTLTISNPSMAISHGDDVLYTLTYFNADQISLTPDDITINTTGSAVGIASEITETDIDIYTVTISDIGGKGTISISVSADTASNDNGNTVLAVGPSTAFKVRAEDEKEDDQGEDEDDQGEDEDDQGEDEDGKLKPSAPAELTPEQIETIIEKAEKAEKAVESPFQYILPEKGSGGRQLEECKIKYPEAVFDDVDVDTDGDGLSNKTECYIKTHPLKNDTDGDKCLDGDEVNLLFSDPNDSTDCDIEKKLKKIIITNPQPDWIIKKLEITGITPKETKTVTLVAIPAKRKFVKGIMQALESGNPRGIQNKTKELNDFLVRHQYYGYEYLWNILKSLDKKTEPYGQLLSKLKQINTEPIVLGTITMFSPSSIEGGLYFELNPDVDLNNRQLYDLVAIAILDDKKEITSKSVRFSMDDNLIIKAPVPLTIANRPLKAGNLDIRNEKIKIDENEKVIITGSSVYGARVFAIWQSVVLASSTIADSEEGAFSIQAPRLLEMDTNHKVTLYSVSAVDDMMVRSENVNIHFRLTKKSVCICLIIGIILLIILSIILVIYMRKMKCIKEVSKNKIINKLLKQYGTK